MLVSRQAVQKLILALALSWLLWGAGLEAFRSLDRSWWHSPEEVTPGMWRFSTPAPERLLYCTQVTSRHIPAGSRVAFSSPPGPANAALFRFWWARYWLPQYTLIPVELSALKANQPRTDYLIAYGQRFDHPAFELLLEDWYGALYRRRAQP